MPDAPRDLPLPVFRFVGHSGSGKTSLLEAVVAELTRRGLRVAIAKDTHHDVELDQPGKDTWRLARAGASQVVLASDGQLVLLQRRPARPTLVEIAALVAPSADLLLAEGFRHDSSAPAVVVYRAEMRLPLPALSGQVAAIVTDGVAPTGWPRFAFAEVIPLCDDLVSTTKPPGGV